MADSLHRLDDKIAIVTGAAQGIGAGIARRMAEAGAAVVVADIQDEQGQKTVDEIVAAGGTATFIHADVADETSVEALIAGAVDTYGKLDIVANNAALIVIGKAEDLAADDWDRMMAVNVRSIYLTTRFAVPHMRKQGGGSIICVGSISSFVGQLNTPCYTASKGAVLMLTKSFAVDYGRDGIRANCICPGITDTPLLRHHVNQAPDPEALMAERLARVPTGEMLYPDDMGNAAVFLCSDAARGITGTSLVVDGGYISCAEFAA